jgi:hypothetical protein
MFKKEEVKVVDAETSFFGITVAPMLMVLNGEYGTMPDTLIL